MQLTPNELSAEKKRIRLAIQLIMNSMTESERTIRSNSIFEQIEHHDAFIHAEKVMIFWSLPDEVQTKSFILKWFTHKNIYLPVIENQQLQPALFTSEKELHTTPPYAIGEPTHRPFLKAKELDLILVPGLAFYNNYRLGRGKGYYDQFLPTTQGTRIGLCYSNQILEIPIEPHDAILDEIITDNY